MENEDNPDVGTSTEISSACTSPQDCDLFVNMLPMKFTDEPLLAPSGTPPECTMKQKCTHYLGIDPLDTSKRQILPSSFIGDRRYMVENFQDAVAVSRVHGAPDIFTTFTCNPKWPEITEALSSEPGKRPHNRADMTVRVYNMKLNDYLHDIKEGEAFGPVVAVLHTVEFQERGLPHAHILVWQNKKKRDEVVKDTVLESTTGPVPLPADRMQKSQSASTPVCAMKQKCTGEQLLAPSGTTHVTQNVGTTEIPRGIGFASLTNKPFIFPPDLLKFLRRKRRIIRLPDPVPAHAAFNRKKRKLIIDSQRKKTPTLTSLPFLDGSSSEDISIVTDLANEAAYGKPNHTDPECSFTALASPPSVNKPSTLRTSAVLIDSKVRKPLFQDDEDKGKATGLGDEALERAGGFAETDEVVSTSSKKAKP